MEQGREIFDQDEDGRIAELELRENYDLNNISQHGIFPDKVGNNIALLKKANRTSSLCLLHTS